MRISDWSSDVCSSDLLGRAIYRLVADRPLTPGLHRLGFSFTRDEATQSGGLARLFINSQQVAEQVLPRTVRFSYSGSGERSEEHTSELQSLMRISYAVFCLKKKTPIPNTQNAPHHKRPPESTRTQQKQKKQQQ